MADCTNVVENNAIMSLENTKIGTCKNYQSDISCVNVSQKQAFDNSKCSGFTIPEARITSTIRNLRARSNRNKFQMKVRQKRQTMQSMTRPLKQWLCDHRGNPYPTKTEKETLAFASRMTMVQVSNWFANARRRLKSTVKGDNLSWSKRVKLYNSNVTGNAELLSVSSEDSLFDSDEDDGRQKQAYAFPVPVQQEKMSEPMEEDRDIVPSRSQTPTIQNPIFENFDQHWSQNIRPESGSQHKYKQTMLHRYLTDTFNQSGHRIGDQTMEVNAFNKTRSRRPSGSIGSRDYEEMSTSSGVSYSDCYPSAVLDDGADDLEAAARRRRISGDVSIRGHEDIRWKEISAAMALTSLSRSRQFPIT